MAEQIPYGVVVNIISELASLAFREIGRAYGVMDELAKLKETVECIQAELCDAEERQHEDRAVKVWIRRLREVVHDADNLFDDLLIEDSRRKVDGHGQVRVFFSSRNQLVFRRKMARKVEKIRQKFNDVSKDMSKLNLSRRVVIFKENESSWRETSSSVLQSEIIGRAESKKEIIDLLKQSHTNRNVSLIAIVGIGGLGKTALAQLVYNDADVRMNFQKKMWVCVSEDFEVKSILKKMLKSLEVKDIGDLQLDQLQKKLDEELNGKKYMLVLDDVWNESPLKWNALRTYLMCGCEGSKILVTTRSKNVAQTMGIKTPYVLEGLTKEQSWALLKKVALGEDASRMGPDLESIGERIAEKCSGVPLAIRTVGGLLQSKHEESEWTRILDGDFWRLCDENEGIMLVLKLSYQNLPLELRQCFAYCCLYPKDWEIDSDKLIQLWMAQGYLGSSSEMHSLEDVGNRYVKILLTKSFFQEASMNEYGDIESFKMHDLMHDLAKSIGGNDCYYLEGEGERIVGRPTHIALVSNLCASWDLSDASHLRTFVYRGMGADMPSIKRSKYLRVLDLSFAFTSQLPKFIDKIKHLRYLDLSYCDVLSSLPKSIGNLVSLQTLKLRDCDNLVFSVEVITKLINLRHLDIHNCKASEEKMPAGLRKLTSLQYLSDFVVADSGKSKGATLNELKELNNIRSKLTIKNLGLVKEVDSESQETNLKAKRYIQRLELLWGMNLYDREIENKNSDSLQLLDNLYPRQNLKKLTMNGYPGLRFSHWVSSLPNIVEIRLDTFSSCQHLPPLERLQCLRKLEILDMKELKCIYYEENSSVFFPSLKTLILSKCPKLRGWQRLDDDNKESDTHNHLSLPPFPCLSYLCIFECPNMTCMLTFPYLVEDLRLVDSSMKPLIETCFVQLVSSSLYPLSAVRHLDIEGVREVESMAEEWMQNLTSLEHLSLRGSSTVPPLLRQLQHLPSQLQQLEIWEVDELVLWKDEEDDSQAPFHCLHSLQKICFSFCRDMKALPEQIGKLQSLKHIEIDSCYELESLPEAIHYLTNLQTLRIIGYGLLLKRCKAETGEDWPKIVHIPNISIEELPPLPLPPPFPIPLRPVIGQHR